MHANYKEASPLFDGNPADNNVSESTYYGIKYTCKHKRAKLAVFSKKQCTRIMESSSILDLRYNGKLKAYNNKYSKGVQFDSGGKRKATHNTAI